MLDAFLDFIATRIQKLRDEKNISARDLSLSLGQNGAYINKIETKLAKPSIEGLFYISEYFGITLGEFFDENMEHPERVQILLNEVKPLDSDSLDLLIGMAKKMNNGK